MKTSDRAREIYGALQRAYPEAQCSLGHENPYQLWVATVLSAQCTDKRVNLVTPALFRRCPDAHALAEVPEEELQALIHSTGFFRNKAKNLKTGASLLVERHGGRVPDTMEGLLEIPGVARKTANVLLGSAFGKNEGVVVDTHVGRLSRRMGLSQEKDPVSIERDLMRLFPKEAWALLSHLLIAHGRAVCAARKPRCGECILSKSCPKRGV